MSKQIDDHFGEDEAEPYDPRLFLELFLQQEAEGQPLPCKILNRMSNNL